MPRRPHHGPCPKRPGRPNAKARRTHGTPVGAARPLQWREQAETTRKKERHACPACLLHDGGGAPFVKPVCAVFHSVPRFCGKTRCFLLLYSCFLLLYKRTAGVSITRFAPPKRVTPAGRFGPLACAAHMPFCPLAGRARGGAAAPAKGPKTKAPGRFWGPAAHTGRAARAACAAARARPWRRQKGPKKLYENWKRNSRGPPAVFFAFCPACGLRLPRRAQARAGPMPARLSGAKWCRPAGAFRTARARPFWGAARPQWARPRRPAARPA